MRFFLLPLLFLLVTGVKAQTVYESLLLLSNPTAAAENCSILTNNLVFTTMIATQNTANSSLMTTVPFTPTSNAMLVAFASFSPAGTEIITNSGTPQLTWWRVAATNYNTLASPAQRLVAYVTQLSPGMAPGAIQLVLTNGPTTGSGANIAVIQVTGADTNQLWGSNAVVQVVHNGSNATINGQITFSAPNAGGSNGLLVAFADDVNSSADMSAGSGFTERTETAYNTPATGLFSQSRTMVPSSLTLVTNVSTSRDWAAIGLEIKAGTNICPDGVVNDPTEIPNLHRWYDANYLALIDGDFIDSTLQWTNRAYAGDNLTGSGGARPTFRTFVQNDLPGILYDGTDDITSMTAIGSQTAITVTIVVRSTFTPSEATVGLMDYSADTDELFLDQNGSSTTSIKITDSFRSGAQSDAFPSGFVLTNAMALTWACDGTDCQYYMNGTNFGSDAIGSFALNLDRVGTVSGNAFKGYMLEITVHTNYKASATQVMQLWQNYLNPKWFPVVPWTPPSGLVYWFSPRQMVGTNDNERLGTIQDFSGNNYHGWQTTAAQQPYYVANAINNLPAFRFYEGTNYFSLSNVLSGLTAAEIYMVVKIVEDPPVSAANSGLWALGSDTSDNHFPFTDGNVYDGAGTASRKSTGNPTLDLTEWRLYNVAIGSSAWTNLVDTVVHFGTGVNTVGWETSPILGNSKSVLTYGMNGWIAEFLLFDHILSSADRQNVEDNLDIIFSELAY